MCISQEIPGIETEIHQVFPSNQVECIAVCDDDNTPLDPFLVNYIKGYLPFNQLPTTYEVLYNTDEAEAAYGLTAHSTWIVIDQERRVVFRENNNTDPQVLEMVIEKIEELLNPGM